MRCDESVRPRVTIELAIVHELIKRLIDAGHKLTVFDGEDDLESTHEQSLVTAIFAVDEARLYAGDNSWVLLVMGNDGTDVVSDYTTNLEPIMEPLFNWIETAGYAARP